MSERVLMRLLALVSAGLALPAGLIMVRNQAALPHPSLIFAIFVGSLASSFSLSSARRLGNRVRIAVWGVFPLILCVIGIVATIRAPGVGGRVAFGIVSLVPPLFAWAAMSSGG